MSKRILSKSQRQALETALADDFIEVIQREEGQGYAEGVAKHGFVGFMQMTDRQLVNSAQAQGLEQVLEDEGVPELPPEPKLAKTERQRIIGELVSRFLADVLEEPVVDGWKHSLTVIGAKGFRGYRDWSDAELIREAKKAGIGFSVQKPRRRG